MTTVLARLSAALADRYRIEREVGAGGMATVYLATDLRHDRPVAVKVLRPDLSASIGSERFLQEIRIAARLGHPHILPLHDSGEADGLLYYVMPYVPGESLRQRIAREGELPVPDAIRILRDIADAIAYAHQYGVVHRDIKPENVLLSGRHALVADFGVAKAVSEATGRSRLTTAGVALGTPSYMAPEQAVADPHVDHRADIYAIGIVAYEMLAGEPPFTGASPQQVLAAQVTEAPRPLTARRPAVPPVLADAIMRCLEKKPADRWQSAGELLGAIEAAQTPTGGSTPTSTRPLAAVPRHRSWLWPAVAAGVVLIALAIAATALRRPSAARGDGAPSVSLRDRTQLTFTGHVQGPAISPDGKQLAYVTKVCSDTTCAYAIDVQDVGGTTIRRVLTGAASAYALEWSPDRRNILVTGTIEGRWGTHLVSLLGGAPRRVGNGGVTGNGGVSFYAGGDSLLIAPPITADTNLWIGVAALDGVVRDSIPISVAGRRLNAAAAIPGSRWIDVSLVLANARAGERRIIDRSGREVSRQNIPLGQERASSDAVWLATNGAGDQVVIRTAFDAASGRTGRSDTLYTGRFTGFSVTADGATVSVDEGSSQYAIYALDMADVLGGRFSDKRRRVESSGEIGGSLSPDGSRILLRRAEPSSGSTRYRWSVMPFESGSETPLPQLARAEAAYWADSGRIAFRRRDGSVNRLALMDAATGATNDTLTVNGDIWDWGELPGGGWAWVPVGGEAISVYRGGTTRSFPKPPWYDNVAGVSTGSAGAVAFRGWNAGTGDTMGVSVLSLTTGASEKWYSQFTDDGRITQVGDGSILFIAWETAENASVVRLTAPGVARRMGTIPRPITAIYPSKDLRRLVVTTRDYFGDAWLMRVVR
ncbi:MAG: protein kinase [Gemmatimonadota bacterium]